MLLKLFVNEIGFIRSFLKYFYWRNEKKWIVLIWKISWKKSQ